MTTALLTCTNSTSEQLTIDLPAGTLFLCRTGNGQVVVLASNVKLNVPRAGVDVGKGASHFDAGKAEARLITMCMEINKAEPDPTMKYLIAAPRDQRTYDIGAIMAKERFKGAGTQALVWAYADGASEAEINKRLAPPVRKSRYLENLFNLSRIGALDLRRPEITKMMTPSLLEESAEQAAVQWFCAALARMAPAELARYAGDRDSLSRLLGSSNSAQVAIVAGAMLRARDAGLRYAGVRFLAGSSSADQRAAIVAAGGLSELPLAMVSANEAEAIMALDVAESYGDRSLGDVAAGVAESAKSPKVKGRAAKAAAALGYIAGK